MSRGRQDDVAAGPGAFLRPEIVVCASRRHAKLVVRVAIVLVCGLGMPSRVDAQQTMTWDPNGATAGTGGSGTWETTSAIWFNGTSFVPWTNGTLDIALFGGTAGTVTVGVPISAQTLTFQTGGYTVRAGAPPDEVASFYAYDPAFIGGVVVACGDVTGDGRPEVITGAGAGGGPQVRAISIDGSTLTEAASFYAYDPAFFGGVHVAAGDITGDGVAEIITGAGPAGGPHVRAISMQSGGTLNEAVSFFAYDPAFFGGVYVGASDVDGDGIAEIVTGAGAAGGPHVRVLRVGSGTLSEVASFYAYDPAFFDGVRIASLETHPEVPVDPSDAPTERRRLAPRLTDALKAAWRRAAAIVTRPLASSARGRGRLAHLRHRVVDRERSRFLHDWKLAEDLGELPPPPARLR